MISIKGSAQSLPVQGAEVVSIYLLPLIFPSLPGRNRSGIPFQFAPIHLPQGALCCPLLAPASPVLTLQARPLGTEPGAQLSLLRRIVSLSARSCCLHFCMSVRIMLTACSLQVLAEVLTGIPAMDNDRSPVYLVREPATSGSQLVGGRDGRAGTSLLPILRMVMRS